MFAGVADLFADADLVVGNLETPVAPSRPRSGYPRFNADPFLLDALARLGFDVLLTANNHALDQGAEGVVETHEQLEQRGLSHIGTQRSAREPREVLLVPLREDPPVQLALVNATFALNPGTEDAHLVKYLPPGPRRLERLTGSIRSAREAGAECVVVFLHWGREYHVAPTPAQRELARELCRRGADLVVGAGPHVIQPMEFVLTKDGELLDAWEPGARQHFVAYSLGNFVSHQRGVAQYGLLLDLLLEEGEDGLSVRHVSPHVLRSVVQREESARDGEVHNHDSFRLVPVPLEAFAEALR